MTLTWPKHIARKRTFHALPPTKRKKEKEKRNIFFFFIAKRLAYSSKDKPSTQFSHAKSMYRCLICNARHHLCGTSSGSVKMQDKNYACRTAVLMACLRDDIAPGIPKMPHCEGSTGGATARAVVKLLKVCIPRITISPFLPAPHPFPALSCPFRPPSPSPSTVSYFLSLSLSHPLHLSQ